MNRPPIEVLELEEALRAVRTSQAAMVPGSSVARTLETLERAVAAYRRRAWLEHDDPDTPGSVSVHYGDDGRERSTTVMLVPDWRADG